jgi:hypothetical protein
MVWGFNLRRDDSRMMPLWPECLYPVRISPERCVRRPFLLWEAGSALWHSSPTDLYTYETVSEVILSTQPDVTSGSKTWSEDGLKDRTPYSMGKKRVIGN